MVFTMLYYLYVKGVEDPRCHDGCLYGKDNRQYCFEMGDNTVNYTCPEDYPEDVPNVLGNIIIN